MAYSVEIVADSISQSDCRLTTMVVELPRNMLAELNTYKMISKNSGSSRAVPVRTQLQRLLKDPFNPDEFGTDIGGMQAGPPLHGEKLAQANATWAEARINAVESAIKLTTSPAFIEQAWATWVEEKNDDFDDFVLYVADLIENKSPIFTEDPTMLRTTKGLANRLIEPFMWHKVILSFTEIQNLFNQRTHIDAQREIRTAAVMMKEAYAKSVPTLLKEGEWHLPFIQPSEKEWAKENPMLARDAVTARCARVSYLTHDRAKLDLDADYKLTAGLRKRGHMSPFEHAATPFSQKENDIRNEMADVARRHEGEVADYIIKQLIGLTEFAANYRGFGQYRRELTNEAVFTPEVA